MIAYLGYGFDAKDLSVKDMLEFIREYSLDDYESKDPDETDEEFLENYEWESGSRAEVIRDIINEQAMRDHPEYEKDPISFVQAYGQYVVYDSIRFPSDSPRAELIPDEACFVEFIGKYLCTASLTFGNVYVGSDNIDLDPWMD